MAKKTVKGTKPYTGTAKADKITVVGKKNKVSGAGGNDTITVKKGSKHTIYGAAGNDKIYIKGRTKSSHIYGDDAKGKVTGKDTITISGGKKNTIYGGKGADTIIVNKGSSTIYGGKGNDVFVIGKNSTGKAVVKDFRTQSGNFDKVKISGGTVKNIKASGSDRIITGGKSGSLTLKGAKPNKFTVTDTNGEYTVSSSSIGLVLKKSFTGTFTAQSFLNTIDASWVTANGAGVTGNAKANTIYTAKADGGYYQGGGGNDTITVANGSNHKVYGDDAAGNLTGNDTITIKGNTNNSSVYGGKGNDFINVTASAHMIYGGEGVDTIKVNSSNNGQSVHGNEDKDYITVSGGNIHNISGDDGDDVISVTGGVNHHIAGGAGNDKITVSNVTFDENSSYRNSNGAYINAVSGKNTITVTGCKNAIVYGSAEGDTIKVTNSQNTQVDCEHGSDIITISGGNNTTVNLRKGTNRVTVAGRNVTLQQWDYNYYGTDNVTKDIITVNWSNNIGKMTIKTYYPLADAGIDVLTINNAVRSDFKFVKTAAYDLSIQGNNGCSIYIPGWYSTETFKNGITIGGTKVSYADINAAAGFQR